MKPKLAKYLPIALLTAIGLTHPTTASAQGQRRGAFGDWHLSYQFGDRTAESILEIAPGGEGTLNGSWISLFGVTELDELSLDDGALSFDMTRRGPNGETTSSFKGSIADGNLKGTLDGAQGETKVTGERAPRVPRAVGQWAMTIKAGDREFTGKLVIKTGDDGELVGDWTSQRGTTKISDIEYNRGDLSFKRTIETQDSEWEMTFAGNIRGNTLTGTSTSSRGEAEVTGERVGAAAIGIWDLSMQFGQGEFKQRLRVNPDMTGVYGAIPVEKIELDGNTLSFATTMSFGDNEFTMDVKGEIDGDSFKGEQSTSQGSLEITGTKRENMFRGGRRQRQQEQ